MPRRACGTGPIAGSGGPLNFAGQVFASSSLWSHPKFAASLSAARRQRKIKQLIESSVDNVAAGSTLVDEAGVTMNDLVAGVRGIASIMDKLQASFAHETGGLQQVDQSLQKMDAVTQSNGELVRSMAATAGNLKGRGEELSAAVAVFELGVAVVGNQPVHGHAAFDTEETFERRRAA